MPPKKPSASEESYNRLNEAAWVPISSVRPHPKNPNQHPDTQIERLAKLISTHGFRHPIIVSKLSGFVAAGHGRLLAAKKLGLKHVPVEKQDFKDEAEEYQFMVADNGIGSWSDLDLAQINADIGDLGPMDIELLGLQNFTVEIADKLPDGSSASVAEANKSLAERFGVPPFSILDARQGYWQKRKAQWLALGIKSELGRGDSSPAGGGAWPDSKLGADGKFARKDLHSSLSGEKITGSRKPEAGSRKPEAGRK